jgi:hypothetical protein
MQSVPLVRYKYTETKNILNFLFFQWQSKELRIKDVAAKGDSPYASDHDDILGIYIRL